MRYGCVYMIWSKTTKKCYVGQTTNVENRFRQHKTSLKNNRHENKHLQNHVNKYGINDLCFFILQDYIPLNKLSKIEIIWINRFDSFRNGFNNTFGGEKPPHFKGQTHPMSKLLETDVVEIINLYLSGNYSQRKLADMYGVTKNNIQRIIHGKTWVHITNEKTLKKLSNISKTRDETYYPPPSYYNAKEIIWENIKYKSYAELAFHKNKSAGYFSKYIKMGINNDDDAIKYQTFNKINCKKIIVNEEIGFYSQRDCAKFFNKKESTISCWKRTGKAIGID